MTYFKKALLALLFIVPLACKKPTEDLKLVVDTNIIKYSALINVTDASSGAAPAGATITIGGSAADDIYEVSGKKVFTLVNGIISIGLGPSATPTEGIPVTCTVTVSANGYNTTTQTITFVAGQMQQQDAISLVPVKSSGNTVTTFTPTVNPDVTLNFTGTCANRKNILVKPSLYIFYRPTNSNAAYQYLGYLNSGVITTKALALGKSYDFQITYGGQSYTATQAIENSSYNITIDLGTACNNF